MLFQKKRRKFAKKKGTSLAENQSDDAAGGTGNVGLMWEGGGGGGGEGEEKNSEAEVNGDKEVNGG